MNVAFIGLGNMGSNIAQCILKAGFELVVWNRTASKMEPLIERGAKLAASAKEATSSADVVVTSLMDDQSILDTVRAENGILAGLRPGATHVCVMTISPHCADELEQVHKKHGSFYVAAPVSGRPEAAAAGQLISYLAGAPSAIEKAKPVCEAYSKQIIVISDHPRAANVMKLAINYNVISAIEVISETYIFAEKSGLPLEHLRDFYQQLWFAHPAAQLYAEKIRNRDFAGRGGFVMAGGLKDVRLMLSTAAEVGTKLDVGELVERNLSMGVDAGMGEQDWSSIHELARKRAGLN
jgi:3-hydroxyisobutyrate dehydrogenase-like beta-hydroxyacid dehydrogenase